MESAHRSPAQWLRDLVRRTKPPASTKAAEKARSTAVGADPTTAQPAGFERPENSTEHGGQRAIPFSGTCLPATQNRPPMSDDKKIANEEPRLVTELEARSLIDKVGEDQANTTAENTLGDALPTHPGISQDHPHDNDNPIWNNSLKRFTTEKPEDYKMMVGELDQIRKLKDIDTWDTWISRQGLDKDSKETKYKWLRECKAYMPSVALVRTIALELSNLDPYKVARPVVAGVFVLVELCFGLIDPATRDKAMGLLLKTNITISKWASREGDLRRMKRGGRLFMQESNQKVDRIEVQLDMLYFDSLTLMSKIYKDGRSPASRSTASFISGPPEWELKYSEIQNRDSACEQLKGEVELTLKNSETNITALNWIGNRKEDPEPLHQTVKERTGVDDPRSTGGKWFLQTSEFSSWIDDIRHDKAIRRVFWLKGSMGTGKTTLLCRVLSQFDDFPISGVRFVPYYCHGSGSSLGPKYETVLRALCRRLAWNSDGKVAKQAMQLYESSKTDPEAQVTVKKTLEPLLQDLIAFGSARIVFVLDALDECESVDHYMRLLEFLHNLPRGINGPYVLVSSQPHVPVGTYFDDSVTTFDVVQPETRNDMKNFIENQIIAKGAQVRWRKSIFFKNPALLEDLKSTLLESAVGMYRWVEIWLGVFFPRNNDAVRRENSAKELLNSLKDFKTLAILPCDQSDDSRDDKLKMALKDAYEKLWGINGDGGRDNDLQIRLFQIITASFQSLTPSTLLEAICFDPENPENYEKLEHDHVERLYSSFLKVNNQGYLEYEHLSAKKFVEEIRDSDKAVFSSAESHRTMAGIGICALQRPSHPIWSNAEIDLVGRGARPWESPRRTQSTGIKKKASFGQYLDTFWIEHCQRLHQEEQINQRMGNVFRGAHPAVEGWIIYQAEMSPFWDARYRNTLISLVGQDGKAVRPSPFLCMVSFGFSPISRHTGMPSFLPGFDDAAIRNLDQKTPLHVACQASNAAIVEDLLELEFARRGSSLALLTMEDNCGRIPLHFARNDKVVEILLQGEMKDSLDLPTACGPRTSRLLHWENEEGTIPIQSGICQNCSEDLIMRILDTYAVQPQALEYIYRDALKKGKMKTAKHLLQTGADPNIKVDVLDRQISALLTAARFGHTPLATLLLDHNAWFHSIQEVGEALNDAAQDNKLKMLELLLSRGAPVDARGSNGWTALSSAVNTERVEFVKFLLSQGADVGATHWPRLKPLHFAVFTGNIEIAELLLNHGADINGADISGADINGADELQDHPTLTGTLNCHTSPTPLEAAALRGHREMAKFLVSRGADITTGFTFGKLPVLIGDISEE